MAEAAKRSSQDSDHLWADVTVGGGERRRSPRALLPRPLQALAERLLRREVTTAAWSDKGSLRSRQYESEDEYVAHQRSKLDRRGDFIADVDVQVERVLAERLPDGLAGASVLCLAARLGGEVRAFRSAGAFALGIDLNPGDRNPWVLPGNFHDLDFAADSVDCVYTNSLDHALHLDKVAAEVARVVKPGGRVILEIGLGEAEGGDFGDWEATAWQRVDDVVAFFEAEGFTVDGERLDFSEPWPGQQVRLVQTG